MRCHRKGIPGKEGVRRNQGSVFLEVWFWKRIYRSLCSSNVDIISERIQQWEECLETVHVRWHRYIGTGFLHTEMRAAISKGSETLNHAIPEIMIPLMGTLS